VAQSAAKNVEYRGSLLATRGTWRNAAPAAESAERARPLRIGVLGWYGVGNFGNDGCLESVLNFLRAAHPDAELRCFCGDPKAIEERFGVPGCEYVWWPKGLARLANKLVLRIPSLFVNWWQSLKVLDDIDVLIVAGTGYLDDYRQPPWGWPSWVLRWAIAAHLRSVKVALICVGADPIQNPLSRVLLKQAAKLAVLRSYRDFASRERMHAMGVDESHSLVFPDLVFALPTPPLKPKAEGAPLTVAISPMNYAGWSSASDGGPIYLHYVNTLARFTTWLTDQGYRIRFVVGDHADLRTVHAVRGRLSAKALETCEPVAEFSSLHDSMRELAQSDLVVATRFHVAVCALKLARPTISIGYGSKNDMLLTSVGQREFCQHADHVDFDQLLAQFNTLLARRHEISAQIARTVEQYKHQLRLQEELLSAGLLNPAQSRPERRAAPRPAAGAGGVKAVMPSRSR
jgi:polysaccharide pyruvyl transferase WcaK-like protein